MKLAENIIQISKASHYDMANEWFDYASADHFWMKWRFANFLKYAPLELLKFERGFEIGCGAGIFRGQLEDHFQKPIDGCDTNPIALSKCKQGRGNLYYYDIRDRNIELSEMYDAIFLMDVVEHIEKDLDFLNTACAHLRKKGYICINVPSMPSLYSSYDVVAGHYRRYTSKSLATLLEKSGLSIIKILPWGFVMIPLLIVRKLLLKFVSEKNTIKVGFTASKLVENCISNMFAIENSLPYIMPTGTSLLAFARKD